MSVKRLELTGLEQLFAALSLTRKVYLPVEKAGQYDYAPWQPGLTYHPEVLHTVKSAKSVFFPQSEDLIRYKRDGLSLEIREQAPEDEEFVVFGVHACDVAGFEVLDRVFLSEPVDGYYKARREHGAVFSVMCAKPEETCFCGTFGIDAETPGGDVQSWIADGYLYMEALTEKGSAVLAALEGIVTDADAQAEQAVRETREAHKEIMGRLPLAELTTEGFGADADLLTLFNRPEWKELASSCLGCGTCTYVPTRRSRATS